MARQHYFYNVMRKTIIQFLDMFNDIVIARYNPDTGAIVKYVKVPLKFAPKTKQWYWTELRNTEDRRDVVLPMMAVNLENMEYAKDRQVNRNHKIQAYNDGTDGRQFYNPVPYNYIFSLQIAAEYMIDITQIVEQIFPFFTPESYVRITIPELQIGGSALSPNGEAGSDKLQLRVVYDDASKDAPVEIEEAGYRILLWTLSFTVQGYLFTPTQETKPAHQIVQNYYATQASWENRGEDVTLHIGELGNQTMQGLTYATDVPLGGVPVDDSMRELYAYEHFEPPSNYVFNDDVVWLQDDDGEIVKDDKDKNVRE